MDIMELMLGRRTYRRFTQKSIPQDVIDDIIDALRLSSCARNGQTLRLVIVNKPADVAAVNGGMVKWAAALPPELGTPKPGEQPTLFVGVVQSAAGGNADIDTGIALANMTLAAWAKGVGSCIMVGIDRPCLSEMFGLTVDQNCAQWSPLVILRTKAPLCRSRRTTV